MDVEQESGDEKTAKIDLNVGTRLGDYRILFDHLTASTMSSVLSCSSSLDSEMI